MTAPANRHGANPFAANPFAATTSVDNISPPGSWRADQNLRAGSAARCAACGQTTCAHPDAIYQGLAPAPEGTR